MESKENMEELKNELLRIVNEAIMWAAAEEEKAGEEPEWEAYPQYAHIREIGTKLHALEGFKGMLQGHDYVKNTNSYAGSLIERMWDGIGGWQR